MSATIAVLAVLGLLAFALLGGLGLAWLHDRWATRGARDGRIF